MCWKLPFVWEEILSGMLLKEWLKTKDPFALYVPSILRLRMMRPPVSGLYSVADENAFCTIDAVTSATRELPFAGTERLNVKVSLCVKDGTR